MLKGVAYIKSGVLEMQPLFCGIDFGTSNSSIAVSSEKIAPSLAEVENGKHTIPSTIFYETGQKFPLFGEKAIEAYISGKEGRFMRSLKRVLGTDLMSAGTHINGKPAKFENILAQYIKNLKDKVNVKYQQSPGCVVMGRPVHFRDNDTKGDIAAQNQLEQIARNVGFKEIVFQYEPIAAAFAHEDKLEKESMACVIDIGGGTSDFTIIRLGPKLKAKNDRKDDILASSGVRIGGNDFDKNLSISAFMPELGLKTTYGEKRLPVPTSQYFDLSEWSKINSVYTYQNKRIINEVYTNAHNPHLYGRLVEIIEGEKGHLLLNMVEKTKINLSISESYETTLKFLKDAPKISVKKQMFEKSIAPNTLKINQSIAEALKIAQIKAEEINLIILTGGSTEIPYVRNCLCSNFPQANISEENKLSSVGLGLAYDALRRFR